MDSDCTNDLSCWYHSTDKRWLVDSVLKQCWHAGISMVFYQHSTVNKEVLYYICMFILFYKIKYLYNIGDIQYNIVGR